MSIDYYPEKVIKVHRNPCCLFQKEPLSVPKFFENMELLIDYGGEYFYSDGSLRHRYYVWDDGDRTLQRCKNCGALFLVQSDEYHGPDSNDLYIDCFPVDSREQADQINREYSGFDLIRYYNEPRLVSDSNDMLHVNGNNQQE